MAEIIKASPIWRRSSYSGENGACVEARFETVMLLRDSKRPYAPSLGVSAQAWSVFTEFVRRA